MLVCPSPICPKRRAGYPRSNLKMRFGRGQSPLRAPRAYGRLRRMHAHHGHPYALQSASFLVALLFPVTLLVLMAGVGFADAFKRSRKPCVDLYTAPE